LWFEFAKVTIFFPEIKLPHYATCKIYCNFAIYHELQTRIL